MAHNLATTDGNAAMMYTGEVPWHKLGTKLAQPATAREAIEAAGLNYRVDLKSLNTEDGTAVSQRKGVVRSDNGKVLGVVGNSYVPVQNYQAFGFLDAVVAEGGLRYHTAGALGNGERIWMLAKLPSQIRVKNSEDVVQQILAAEQYPRRQHGPTGLFHADPCGLPKYPEYGRGSKLGPGYCNHAQG